MIGNLIIEGGLMVLWDAPTTTSPSSSAASSSSSVTAASGNGNGNGEDEMIVNDEWEAMVPDLEATYNWKDIALDVIRGYTEHTDGSWIEDKEYAIVWHYAHADPEYGRMQASELQKYLARVTIIPYAAIQHPTYHITHND